MKRLRPIHNVSAPSCAYENCTGQRFFYSLNVSAQTQPSNAREQKRVAILLSFWSRWLGLICLESSLCMYVLKVYTPDGFAIAIIESSYGSAAPLLTLMRRVSPTDLRLAALRVLALLPATRMPCTSRTRSPTRSPADAAGEEGTTLLILTTRNVGLKKSPSASTVNPKPNQPFSDAA